MPLVCLMLFQVVVLLLGSPLHAQDRLAEPSIETIDQVRKIKHASGTSEFSDSEATSNSASSFTAPQEGSLRSSAWKLTQGFALCAAVLMVMIYLLRRFGRATGRGGVSRMKIEERMMLTSKTALLLMKVDGRSFLAAVGPEQVNFHEHIFEDGVCSDGIDSNSELLCVNDLKLTA